MNSKEIIVIYKEVGKEPDLIKIKNTKEDIENLIGGEVETISYGDVEIICKKDRKNLKPNVYLNVIPFKIEFSIRGNIIIVRKEENKYKTLRKNQIFKYVKLLKEESFHNKEEIKANGNYFNNIKQNNVINNMYNSAYSCNDETLKMILGIQSIILQYIKGYTELD